EFLQQKEKTLPFFLDTLRGFHTEDEYIEVLLKDTTWKITPADLKTTIRENLNIPLKNMINLIDQLKEKYNLILLSDHVKEWMDYIKEHNNIAKKFNHVFLSCEIGHIKLDKECFEYILNKAQIKSAETIFIDDSILNINSAKEYGIEGILFTNSDDLIKELQKREIL
ncbi:MAG: HAD-IA family hydrolase, partial [Bacilli bacterium]|nr:HAD-IA family hydrolase [Bacilli bacterium]